MRDGLPASGAQRPRGGLQHDDELAARRQGCTLWLRRACPDLIQLLELVGLAGVLQVGREAEGLEQGGVEEVVVPDDPVA